MRCLLVLCLVVTAVTAAEVKSIFQNNPYRPVVVKSETSGRYDPGRYDPGRYDPKKYNSGRYDPGKYDPSKYDKNGRWTPDKAGLYNGDRGDNGDRSGYYNGDRGDRGGAGGFYNGDYGDRGLPGGFYTPEKEQIVIVTETIPPPVIPKVKPSYIYDYKYAIGDLEKELLSQVNVVSSLNNELIGKAFFDYSNDNNEVYRTDYIADSAYASVF